MSSTRRYCEGVINIVKYVAIPKGMVSNGVLILRLVWAKENREFSENAPPVKHAPTRARLVGCVLGRFAVPLSQPSGCASPFPASHVVIIMKTDRNLKSGVKGAGITNLFVNACLRIYFAQAGLPACGIHRPAASKRLGRSGGSQH